MFFWVLALGLAARRHHRRARRRVLSRNDDLVDEFKKLWDDGDDAGDSQQSPKFTPMPPILPPEDDIENPRRVLQFPQYCCRCELRKKLP